MADEPPARMSVFERAEYLERRLAVAKHSPDEAESRAAILDLLTVLVERQIAETDALDRYR